MRGKITRVAKSNAITFPPVKLRQVIVQDLDLKSPSAAVFSVIYPEIEVPERSVPPSGREEVPLFLNHTLDGRVIRTGLRRRVGAAEQDRECRGGRDDCDETHSRVVKPLPRYDNRATRTRYSRVWPPPAWPKGAKPLPRSMTRSASLKVRPIADNDGRQDKGRDAARYKKVGLFARPLPFMEDPPPHCREDDDARHVEGP